MLAYISQQITINLAIQPIRCHVQYTKKLPRRSTLRLTAAVASDFPPIADTSIFVSIMSAPTCSLKPCLYQCHKASEFRMLKTTVAVLTYICVTVSQFQLLYTKMPQDLCPKADKCSERSG